MSSAIQRRVEQYTPEHITTSIREATTRRIARCIAGGRNSVERRLQELDREWDVERAFEAAAGATALAGLVLGATRSRRWLALPPIAACCLLQKAFQGSSPPVTALRWFGVRTAQEIDFERDALRAAVDETLKYSKADWVETASGHVRRASEA